MAIQGLKSRTGIHNYSSRSSSPWESRGLFHLEQKWSWGASAVLATGVLAIVLGIWLGRHCGARQQLRPLSNRTTQTQAQKIRTYWQEPKDEVCHQGQHRGIPNASRLTRAELAGHLVEDDLGWARWK